MFLFTSSCWKSSSRFSSITFINRGQRGLVSLPASPATALKGGGVAEICHAPALDGEGHKVPVHVGRPLDVVDELHPGLAEGHTPVSGAWSAGKPFIQRLTFPDRSVIIGVSVRSSRSHNVSVCPAQDYQEDPILIYLAQIYLRLMELKILGLISFLIPRANDAEGDEGGCDAAGEYHGYQHQQIL